MVNAVIYVILERLALGFQGFHVYLQGTFLIYLQRLFTSEQGYHFTTGFLRIAFPLLKYLEDITRFKFKSIFSFTTISTLLTK